MTMIDTPDGINFAKACSRKGALALEVQGMHRSGGQQTAYSIVKQVYGFRGNRQSVLDDLSEYIECELRLREMSEEEYIMVKRVTEDVITHLGDQLDQPRFEDFIARAERRGAISHAIRQGASDLFYVMIVRQNAGNQ
jgi:hypothetical protein